MKVAVFRLNQADKFILAIVIVDDVHGSTNAAEAGMPKCGQPNYEGPFCVQNPFTVEPDFGVASINYDLSDLLSKAVTPNETL